MTIDEFLEHAWILNDNIPDTVLFTSKLIANDVSEVIRIWSCSSKTSVDQIQWTIEVNFGEQFLNNGIQGSKMSIG